MKLDCLQASLMEVHTTTPFPEPSDCRRYEETHNNATASEPEYSGGCRVPGEDIAGCRSSASPEALLSVTSASQNTNNVHSLSDVTATNLNLQQLEIAVSDAADITARSTDSWRVTIDDMSDEILIKILSHMSFSELIDVIQKVCPHWRRLSQDPELWDYKEYQIRY
ncbi:uncharacterized protein LOC124718961 [Schistocerca piceifrons]|uniref:uncharacterized protein LOC124718961 n=1 Tax=Schistocerca piceifrons TaxID=274613 RepID=UPI001F5F20EB|nr:uncharacterized protein LOC124718961 [Schistocerca piceifrons]